MRDELKCLCGLTARYQRVRGTRWRYECPAGHITERTQSGTRLAGGPYVGRLDPAHGWPCEVVGHCYEVAAWRLNTNGVDGDGKNFCGEHVHQELQRAGNAQLIAQAQQLEEARQRERGGRSGNLPVIEVTQLFAGSTGTYRPSLRSLRLRS